MNQVMIWDRISSIDKLKANTVFLERDKVINSIQLILASANTSNSPQKSEVASIDTADMDDRSIRKWLSELRLENKQVYAYWLAFREGVEIPMDIFIQYYDELWFPAADDIWLSDGTMSWFLELSHEERFTLWSISNSQ